MGLIFRNGPMVSPRVHSKAFARRCVVKCRSRPEDPFLLRDVATVLIDCGLRPEECFRLQWEHVRDGAVHVPFGKTENARRTIPLSHGRRRSWKCGARREPDMGLSGANPQWAYREIQFEEAAPESVPVSERYELPALHLPAHLFNALGCIHGSVHLGYLAGHSDFATTKRYVHPQAHTITEAIERARNAQSWDTSGHKSESAAKSSEPSMLAAIQ